MSETLQGKVTRIIYKNDSNNYTVAKIDIGDDYEIGITGTFYSLNEGQEYRFRGSWTEHPKYGDQLKVEDYEEVIPETADEIEVYLASRVLKGIGPALAKQIVKKFGDSTFDVLDNNIEELGKIPGIGHKKLDQIAESWKNHKTIRNLVIFFRKAELSLIMISKIHDRYGSAAIDIVSANPYRLIDDVSGIGFKTADEIAFKLGFEKDNIKRITAALYYILDQLSTEGHICYPFYKFLSKACRDLEISDELAQEGIEKLITENKFVLAGNKGTDEFYVYTSSLFRAEESTAFHLKELSEYHSGLFDNEKIIEHEVLSKFPYQPDLLQKQAVFAALSNKVSIITGGPGTGKTTIISAIIAVLKQRKVRITLAAPTGRAAKRMSEATGFDASTIHRLLEFSPIDAQFQRNSENPLETDFVILDEVSMIDIELFASLLDALPAACSLLLVGDSDQLPSVGPGLVLKDLIESGKYTVTKLTKIFRQAEAGKIIINAHRINSGNLPEIDNGNENNDFYFVKVEESQRILEMIIELCKKNIPAKTGFTWETDIQILSPMHKGILGVKNLNLELQRELNKHGEEIHSFPGGFRVGDKVMQIKNNYNKEVFNGDLGRVLLYDKIKLQLVVNFDGKTVSYSAQEADELTLAYAATVHKAQGSEYPVIIMPVVNEHYIMLQRNLLYTAVTRGKSMVMLLGSIKALSIAVNNNKAQIRFTRLKEIL